MCQIFMLTYALVLQCAASWLVVSLIQMFLTLRVRANVQSLASWFKDCQHIILYVRVRIFSLGFRAGSRYPRKYAND